ncbi:MAG: hypothetical protein AB1918_02290 [Pseudomonadota bacterium]
MASGRENFEVQVMRDGRWVTETVLPRDAEALQAAKKFLGDKRCAGARVVRNWANRDGTMAETVVFQKTQAVSDEAPINIVQIDKAPTLCAKPKDFFALDSRRVMNRVLRNYLEKVTLTPTEILHSHKELRRLRETGNLVFSAVDHVAGLQVRDSDQGSKQRREEILAALDQIQTRIRRAEERELPALGDRFSAVVAKVAKLPDETPEYLAMIVLSRELIGIRDWLGKLEKLCDLAAAETDGEAMLLLDTVIADVLGANVVQELLGWQPSLGSAIVAMIDLADGRFDPAKSGAQDVAAKLNALLAGDRLPASRDALIDRALRQLRSPNPLHRQEPAKEMEEYRRVLERLLGPGGLRAGAEAAEALTARGCRFVEQGGLTGRRAAITNTARAMPDQAHGVMYLAELTKTEFAEDHLPDILKELDRVFGARVIGELCRRSMMPKDRLIAATNAFNAATQSALPDPVKHKVAEHIDGVLERYLVDEKIIDKLDDPGSPLRDRAVRLVKFCGAGVLPEGKALARARRRIVELLRQPNFDRHFIEGITEPTKAEKALRDFHALLIKAGIA